MIEYQSWEYCRDIGCRNENKEECKFYCGVFNFHDWLQEKKKVVNGEIIVKALAKMYFAYLNKDEPKHKFEIEAIEMAKSIIEEYGGLGKLLKEDTYESN